MLGKSHSKTFGLVVEFFVVVVVVVVVIGGGGGDDGGGARIFRLQPSGKGLGPMFWRDGN